MDIIQKQRQFFRTGQTRDIDFRIESLKKLERILIEKEPEITEALAKDLKKPTLEAYSTEIAYVLEDVRFVLKNIKKWASVQKIKSPLVLQPAKSQIYSEPFGVTLIIAPWNYPFQLVVSPLIGALAAGNTVVLKPSEATPHTQKLLVDMISKTFPAEHVVCLGGGLEESKALLEEKFDFIFFTGSTRVGRIVMEKAAKHLTPVCLELGGKSPCIVDQNVDLKVAARRIIWGKFMNAGQTCVCPDYLMIHENIYEKFVQQLKNTIKEFYGADPKQSSSYPRIVHEQHFDQLSKLLQKGKIEAGGDSDRSQKYIAPTLISGITWEDPIMQDEIFGPLLPMMKYSNLEEALRQIEGRPKPLAFYLFTTDTGLQNQVLNRMSFGGACINDCVVHLANPELPFGGVGDSGLGAYHGRHSFDLFSHKKSVLRKPFYLDANMRYAPYTDMKLKLIRFFMG